MKRQSDIKLADVRKLKPKRAITTMSPFAMTFGGDKDIPVDGGRKSRGRGSAKKKKKKRTNSSDQKFIESGRMSKKGKTED